MLLSRVVRGTALATPGCEGGAWTATRFVAAGPRELLEALTDPELISLWAPVDFRAEGACTRLRPGGRVPVRGSLAGVAARFEVEVLRSDEGALELRARGPVELEVAYRFLPRRGGVLVVAAIELGPARGLGAGVLRAATAALLAGGALERALARLERSLGEVAPLAA